MTEPPEGKTVEGAGRPVALKGAPGGVSDTMVAGAPPTLVSVTALPTVRPVAIPPKLIVAGAGWMSPI